jgi:hypothetical protein
MKVQPDNKMVALHISEYKNIIYNLRSEIENLKSPTEAYKPASKSVYSSDELC